LSALSQITLSSCSLIQVCCAGLVCVYWGHRPVLQSALPALLTPEPGSADEAALAEFRTTTIATLEVECVLTVGLGCARINACAAVVSGACKVHG
jgi:hypothetical protein